MVFVHKCYSKFCYFIFYRADCFGKVHNRRETNEKWCYRVIPRYRRHNVVDLWAHINPAAKHIGIFNFWSFPESCLWAIKKTIYYGLMIWHETLYNEISYVIFKWLTCISKYFIPSLVMCHTDNFKINISSS